MAQQPPPGWYSQPDGTLRYWDGHAWTPHVAPPKQQTPFNQPAGSATPLASPTRGGIKKPSYQQVWFWLLIAFIGLPLSIFAFFSGGTSATKPSSGFPTEAPIAVPTKSGTPTVETAGDAAPSPSVEKDASTESAADDANKRPNPTTTPAGPNKEPQEKPRAEAAEKVAKIGDTLRVGDLSVKVVSAERKTRLSSASGSEKGNWMLVTVKVTNMGSSQATVNNSDFHLFGADGTRYSTDKDGRIHIDSGDTFPKRIDPNTSFTGKLIFAIPESAQNLTLKVSPVTFSPKTGEISLGKK